MTHERRQRNCRMRVHGFSFFCGRCGGGRVRVRRPREECAWQENFAGVAEADADALRDDDGRGPAPILIPNYLYTVFRY